jgi:uncharacterized YccA/Bax inhibitor family protein
MTRAGVAKALATFFLFAVIGAFFGWGRGDHAVITSGTNELMLAAIVLALVLSFVIIAKPKLAATLGIAYALLEGFAVGIVSAVYNATYHGIVAEALGATVCVALCVWFLYGMGIIKVTDKTRRVIAMAVMGAFVFYAISIVSMLLGGPDLDGKGGVLGIGISLVLAVIAAATFLTDFDRIDQLIAANADASYDWYGAFSLLISFVWLYLEILNILGKLRGGGGSIRR